MIIKKIARAEVSAGNFVWPVRRAGNRRPAMLQDDQRLARKRMPVAG
jgi:hypothetical protein